MKKQLSKSHIPVAQNASGRNLNVPVYKITDGLPGPSVYIQSSIHGAEVQGNIVIYHLLQALQNTTIYGEITLVPNCNPVGTNIKAGEYTLGRFDPVNGTNWNRGYHYDHDAVLAFAETVTPEESVTSIKARFRHMLTSALNDKRRAPWGLGLANQLNLTLQQLAVGADIVLDLHNGPVSTRHIYIPEYAKQAARQFSIPHCIFIPNKFAGALDEACFCPWWTLQSALEKRFSRPVSFDVEAFTLEMGSQEVISFSEGEEDAKGIMAYLSAKGVLDKNAFFPMTIKRYGVALENYKTLFTDFGGMVEYCAKPGRAMKKGKVLARVLNIDDLDNQNAIHTITAPCDLIPILHFPSASVLSGTQLYKCFTNYYAIEAS
ncbi:succinylglutamate desuccinylase/aspartoacylase family protein [Alteromonas sediminis]|uniref:Succinylglutamate desuccinylase/aspartoacylase family protein n=1 Tax=Alteromonas sediminis TaxID=2259342 RepID=A0A3N5Y1L9_9ALTE|nr:succinylglutamate desuccinylase/aspartoacylase family protein [Alteromonas sediminis]RPJ67080.1 succinylglutamate desuccinylase/aspartoacylase family protein [Alteromonas sediminis]